MELTLLTELTLMKQASKMTVALDTIGISQIKGLSFNRMFVMDVMIY